MKYFAQAVSYIFHPIFLPLLVLIIFFQVETVPNSLSIYDALYNFRPEHKFIFYLILGILLFLAPLLSMGIMVWTKMVKSIHLESKEERRIPFIIVTFYFGLAYFFLHERLDPILQHDALMSFVFGMLVVFVTSYIINFYLKVSLHAAASFGAAATVLAYFQTQIDSPFWIPIVLILAAGLVSTARIYLKAHTEKEVLVGTLIGSLIMYLCVYNGFWI